MMKTLSTTLALGFALLSARTVLSQDYSLTLDLTAGSQYIFRGIELGDNTLHPSVEFTQGDLYAGMWVASPIGHRSEGGFGDEIDFYAGYGWALNDSFSLDAGATFYYYPDSTNSLEGYFGVSTEVEGFTISAYLYRDIELDVWTAEVSGGYGIPIADNASLDLAAYIGKVEVDNGLGDYTYLGLDAVVPYQLNDSATVSVGLHFADHTLDGAADNHIYLSSSLTIGF